MATDGFVRLPNWLIDDSDLTLHELAVYIVLLRYRDPKNGKCFPGMTTIADRARVSRETVKRIIPRLQQKQMIKVTKRREGTKNLPNVYEVAVPSEAPEFIWTTSQRGRRIPKRGRHSETPPAGGVPRGRHSETPPRHSETLPRHSETPGVGTPSAPNKIQRTRSTTQNHEQALRQEQELPPERFTFNVEEKATKKQLSYLSDLYIFLTERIPEQRTRDGWGALNSTEASELIRTYWGQLDRGRGGMWTSNVDETHSAYRALSLLGRKWIARGCLPDSLEAA